MNITAEDLGADVSGVLRRVESGQRLTVTMDGRPIAEIVPLTDIRRVAPRPTSIPWETFVEGADGWRADAPLSPELAALIPDTTDDATHP